MQGIAQKILANPGKYSIQQLQQGVERGIIPAYIAVPLIQEKVQQQKQMQMSQAMQQGPAQNQQTIADQVMQEAQGVAALPTSLPTEYAAGGIVAFEEGGPVERYQSAGLVQPQYETPYDRMNRLNRERAAASQGIVPNDPQAQADREAMLDTLRKMKAAGMDIATLPGRAVAGAAETAITRPLRALGLPVPYLPDSFYGGDRGSMTPYFDKLRANEPQAAAPATAPVVAPPPPTVAKEKPAAGQGIKTPGVGAGITGLGAGLGITGRPTLTTPAGSSYEQMAKDYFNQYGKEATERDTALDEKVNAEREKVKGQAFEDYKATLQKEAMDAGADRNQAKYMSMFKAGLAMMAGTSRNALENIGKGAMVGAEDYQAAVKDLKKAERERAKELANIEQARRAEALGDRDTAIKRLDSARDRADARARYVGEGIYKATGLDKNQAFELAKTQFSSDSDIFRTNLAGQYQLAGQRIGAEATVAAANARAARGEGITQYQLARLRSDAEKQVDPNAIRAQVAQQLKLSKPPKPGADQTFEQRFQQAYAAAIDDRVSRNLGYGFGGAGTGGGQGFQLPEGYKFLGMEK